MGAPAAEASNLLCYSVTQQHRVPRPPGRPVPGGEVMTLVLLLVAAIVLGAGVYAFIAYRTWARFRGTRVVVCPENHQTAAVEVDAGQAAVSAVMGSPDLHLQACSRWP